MSNKFGNSNVESAHDGKGDRAVLSDGGTPTIFAPTSTAVSVGETPSTSTSGVLLSPVGTDVVHLDAVVVSSSDGACTSQGTSACTEVISSAIRDAMADSDPAVDIKSRSTLAFVEENEDVLNNTVAAGDSSSLGPPSTTQGQSSVTVQPPDKVC